MFSWLFGPWEMGLWFQICNFQTYFSYYYWSTFCEIILRWIQQQLIDDGSTLVQVMGCCHQATTHYLNQCWQSTDAIFFPCLIMIYLMTESLKWQKYHNTVSHGTIEVSHKVYMKCKSTFLSWMQITSSTPPHFPIIIISKCLPMTNLSSNDGYGFSHK